MTSIFRFIPTGLSLPIIKGPLRGSQWLTGAAAGEAKGISIYFKNVEDKQLELVKLHIHSTDIAFDLGANAGMYSILFAKKCKQVFAFEPLPRNQSFLYRTIEINKCTNVSIIPFAVGSETKYTKFLTGMNNAVGKIDQTGDIFVFQVSLDDFCSNYKIFPTIIKIDVEGSELVVLLGAAKLLKKHPKLFISFHRKKLQEACIRLLRKYKYKEKLIEMNSDGEQSEYLFS